MSDTSQPGGEIPDAGRSWDAADAPYGAVPPTAPAGPPPEALAGFWIRFAGALLDAIIIGVASSLIFAADDVLGVSTQFVLGGLYFTFLHSTRAGQTLGQRVCGIRLVDARTGGQVSAGAAAGRWIMSYVSGFAILLGFLWMLWDPMKQTWHDKVAGTLVVYSQAVPPPTESLFER